jgi:hypothetical protein
MPIKLTKKIISGYGSYHVFQNKAEELLHVKCTDQEYKSLGEKDGSKNNPIIDGYTWLYSLGGTPEIEGRLPKEGEMFDMPNDKKVAVIQGVIVTLEEGDLDLDNNFIGEVKIK